MGMTMSQKILAAHAGLSEVKAGQLHDSTTHCHYSFSIELLHSQGCDPNI